ncbi:MerR family transcriptional regulator [Thiohalorhabdus sp.]|uniref:MerR family transcriptional regulator n=1 Tax=Thiohalorhabdus sp. TaxID=3094134 RepID=UPI002FC2CC82
MTEWPKPWKIGELAVALGTTTRTLRFYEEQGLLTPRRTERGTRLYTAHDRQRAGLIRHQAGLGIPLEEIRALVTARPASATGAEASRRVAKHLRHLYQEAQSLRDMAEALMADASDTEAVVQQCRDCPNPPTPTGCPECPALARLGEDPLLNLVWDPEECGGPS